MKSLVLHKKQIFLKNMQKCVKIYALTHFVRKLGGKHNESDSNAKGTGKLFEESLSK